MRLPIATKAFEMDRSIHSATARLVNRVARLVRSLVNAKTFAAERKHFGHEGQTFKPAMLIQRGEDFRFAADFHDTSG